MRWWRLIDKRRCLLANLGSEIRELKDLSRHRSCTSCFTGSLHIISTIRSNGRVGKGGADVRVPVAVVSSMSDCEETTLSQLLPDTMFHNKQLVVI
jgi:precorrin-4 methylase